jgi:hypothetical protein
MSIPYSGAIEIMCDLLSLRKTVASAWSTDPFLFARLQPRFGMIDVVLDATQNFVINNILIA